MMEHEKRKTKRAALHTSSNLTVSTSSHYCSGVPWYQAFRVIEYVGAMNSNFWVAVTVSDSL